MGLRFVVHEHHSTRIHYDFRMEWEGVLRSWAVPKGPSMNPADKRLAVQVDDHALEFVDFEGIIPEDQPGAGPMIIWDTGSYELIEADSKTLHVLLHGETLKGVFTLTRLRAKGRRESRDWLLIKRKDASSRSDWTLARALTDEKKYQLREMLPPC